LSQNERFDKLEIGIVPAAGAAPPPQPPKTVIVPSEAATEALDASSGLHVSSERERIVLRLNGHVYREGDPDLPPFAARIVAKIREKGLSPELMDELRREIPQVRVHPADARNPTRETLEFWREAGWRGDRWERGWGGYRVPVGLPWGMPLAVVVAIILFILSVWWFIQKQVGDTLQLIDKM